MCRCASPGPCPVPWRCCAPTSCVCDALTTGLSAAAIPGPPAEEAGGPVHRSARGGRELTRSAARQLPVPVLPQSGPASAHARSSSRVPPLHHAPYDQTPPGLDQTDADQRHPEPGQRRMRAGRRRVHGARRRATLRIRPDPHPGAGVRDPGGGRPPCPCGVCRPGPSSAPAPAVCVARSEGTSGSVTKCRAPGARRTTTAVVAWRCVVLEPHRLLQDVVGERPAQPAERRRRQHHQTAVRPEPPMPRADRWRGAGDCVANARLPIPLAQFCTPFRIRHNPDTAQFARWSSEERATSPCPTRGRPR